MAIVKFDCKHPKCELKVSVDTDHIVPGVISRQQARDRLAARINKPRKKNAYYLECADGHMYRYEYEP
jgi:hypothetical protein